MTTLRVGCVLGEGRHEWRPYGVGAFFVVSPFMATWLTSEQPWTVTPQNHRQRQQHFKHQHTNRQR
jgi:hypothetical protein